MNQMKKESFCIAFASLLLCSCKSYHYNDNRSFLLVRRKERPVSEVSPLPRSIGPKHENRFTEAFEKASEEAMFKADSILRNKYPQFYEKGKD